MTYDPVPALELLEKFELEISSGNGDLPAEYVVGFAHALLLVGAIDGDRWVHVQRITSMID